MVSAGGFMDTPNQRLAVRQVGGITSADDLARSIVAFRNGTPLRLGDVAQVVIGHPAPIGDGVINDGPGILLIVEKQPWGNTLDVTHGVERMLAELRPGLTGVDMDSTIFRPATFIELSIDNLMRAMWLGCVLVIVVLVLFLNDWRTAFISLTAIPLSLTAAALALTWQGQTINTMVLAGLVIALGEVVDDAIIDVENILRRLRLNRGSGNPKPAFAVVLSASLEVRSAVVYASLIVVLVFLPVFFLDGLAGTFFRPLAMSYILAILASLVVALTVTPALCLLLLHGTPERKREGLVVRAFKGVYAAILPRLLPHAWLACGALAGLAFAGTWVVWKKLGEEFLPNFKERDFLMHWVEKPGTSVEAMTRISIAASKELRSVDGVRNMGAHIGRAEVADEVVGPNFTELWVSVDPSVDYDSTVAKLQSVVDGYPGLYRDLLTYLRERIKEVLTGASASIVVRIFGPDLDILRDRAAAAGALLEDVPGVSALKVEALALVPQVQVRLRTEAGANFGLSAADVRRAVTTLVKGQQVGEVFEEQKVHRVTVWSLPAVRGDLRSLRELLIQTPAGAHVPLGDVADLAIVPAPNEIKREGASRRIDVTCNVSGRDLGSVARDVQTKIAALEMPRGYHAEVLGEYAARESAQRRLLILSGLALAGILVLLTGRFSIAKTGAAGGADVAICTHWRCAGCVAERRGSFAGLAGGLRHGAGHRRTKRHHAGEPPAPPRTGGGRNLRSGPRAAWLRRAPRANCDDGGDCGTRAAPAGSQREHSGTRDRVSDGICNFGWACDVHGAQSVRPAAAICAVWTRSRRTLTGRGHRIISLNVKLNTATDGNPRFHQITSIGLPRFIPFMGVRPCALRARAHCTELAGPEGHQITDPP